MSFQGGGHFLFSVCQKCLQHHSIFQNYKTTFYVHLTKSLGVKCFRSTSHQKDKLCFKKASTSAFFCFSSTFSHEKFNEMISYYAQWCILKWQTMLPKEVFIFFARKIHFSFFECPKRGFFVKDLPNICCKILLNQFSKILRHI